MKVKGFLAVVALSIYGIAASVNPLHARDLTSCIQETSRWGEHCGSPDSLQLIVRNNCSEPAYIKICLAKKGAAGTVEQTPAWTLETGIPDFIRATLQAISNIDIAAPATNSTFAHKKKAAEVFSTAAPYKHHQYRTPPVSTCTKLFLCWG